MAVQEKALQDAEARAERAESRLAELEANQQEPKERSQMQDESGALSNRERRTRVRAWRRIECGQNDTAQSRRSRAIFSAGA